MSSQISTYKVTVYLHDAKQTRNILTRKTIRRYIVQIFIENGNLELLLHLYSS